jgi:hypothetical protein
MEVSGQSGGKEVPVPTEEKARYTPVLGISEKRKPLAVVGNVTTDRPAHGAVLTHTPPSQFLGTVHRSNVLPFRRFCTRDSAPSHAALITIRSILLSRSHGATRRPCLCLHFDVRFIVSVALTKVLVYS